MEVETLATYEVLQDDASRKEALLLQARRYREVGYLDRSDPDDAIRDQFVDVSTYFGARSSTGELVGVARLITYTEELGLPTLNDFALLPRGREWLETVDLTTVTEFSALAVDPEVDSGVTISRQLYRALAQYSLFVSGQVFWCAALANRVRRLLNRVVRLQAWPLADATFYRGAETMPVVIDLMENLRYWGENDPAMREFFLTDVLIDLTTGNPVIADHVLTGVQAGQLQDPGRVLSTT